MTRPGPHVVIAAAAAVLLAGCSTVVAGSPMTQSAQSEDKDVDVTLLDTGDYPTKAAPPMGNAGTEEQGRLLEAQRMANNVVGPWEVDPNFVAPKPSSTTVIKDSSNSNPGGLGHIVEPEIADAAGAHNFVLGFASTRGPVRNPGLKGGLCNAVLRFADPASAAAAAADMAAKAVSLTPEIPKRPMPIPGHSDASASTYDRPGPGNLIRVDSFTAHGAYVLYQRAASQGTVDASPRDAATQLISGTLDRQKPLIDRFYPADPATFADLPRDPTELLARTIPINGNDINPNRMTVYEPRAALNFQTDPVRNGTLFNKTGVQHIAMAKTTVYAAIDGTAAAELLDGATDEVAKQRQPYKPAEGVPHLSNSKCFALGENGPSPTFSCYAIAGRYLIEADSAQLADAQQISAAQYRMLVDK